MSKAEEIETNRERFICLLYRKSDGEAKQLQSRNEIMEELGLDLDMFDRVINHFKKLGCLITSKESVALSDEGADYAVEVVKCEDK